MRENHAKCVRVEISARISCHSVQFSSVCLDFINQEMLHPQYRGGFHASIDGWHHHWTHLSYHKWHCSNLFFWKGKGQIPSFKAYHPSSEKPKGSGFKPKTVPELGIGESPLSVHHYHLRTTLTQLNDRRTKMDSSWLAVRTTTQLVD